MMNKALKELIRISNAAGKDSTFVQGGGGNTSVKTNDGKYMYIKASGTALKDMDAASGWRRICLKSVLAIVEDQSLMKMEAQAREAEVVNRLALSCNDDVIGPARPSVEAHLHGFLNKCVIHLHPSAVGAYVNAKGGKALLEKLFKDEKLPPLWVPYVDPGFMLARKISVLTSEYKYRFGRIPAILFLEKHGLFVSAKTPDAALRITRRVIKQCNAKLKQLNSGRVKNVDAKVINELKLGIRKAFFDATGQYMMVSYFYDQEIASFMANKNAKKMLAISTLTPDELVYSNGSPLWLDKCDPAKVAGKISAQIEKAQKPALAFVVKDVGLFAVGTKKIAQTIRDITVNSFFIRLNASRLSGIASLNKRQREFINKWEAESFRRSLSAGTSDGVLNGRIAVVTGAGSGIGRSIAIGLAKAGAIVALADIDEDSAARTQRIIAGELPGTSTKVVKCNVTDEVSVDKAFTDLLNYYGGLDIVVNAAGVAPAAALVDMDVNKWRFALEVNLTGYFLMARSAARIMKNQQMGGSIVNISSKSGLEASKNNTPYNATKAGQIHMARGWAMELGPCGIRVNNVCPGNVFEGSKIWNPGYIKVCAKKYGIKPDEVIPFYVNKTCLKREIKGQDIADAVVFLSSDNARTITGQTLVADSGQVMVR